MLQKKTKLKNKNVLGFTLVEVVVGIGILAVLSVGVLGSYNALTRTVKVAREKLTVTQLAQNYLETARNLPYQDIGTQFGNPGGPLPSETTAETFTANNRTYSAYYDVQYIDDPADGTILAGTDSAPNDYKQIKLIINGVTAGATSATFSTNVAPRGQESTSGGNLLVNVITSRGEPVPAATVAITNTVTVPNLNITRSTDVSGNVLEVGLQPSVNTYHIMASKPGMTSAQTIPITPQNPDPAKPDATIATGVLTKVTLIIDFTGNLTVKTLDQFCQPLPNIGVNVHGEQLLNLDPIKYLVDVNVTTDGAGVGFIPGIMSDVYTPNIIPNSTYMLYGSSPAQNIQVMPDSNQTINLIVGPYTTNSLLVIVKDASTKAVIEGAQVHLRKGGSVPQDYYGTAGGNIWTQKSWVGGPGQTTWSDTTKYLNDSGTITINSAPTGIQLDKISGRYVAQGELESSSFDTGAPANFTTLVWEPTSQIAGTSAKVQVATNNDNATWNFKGPDGTAASYYTAPITTLHSSHISDRYVKYKIFLSTANDKYTPVISNLSINYVSGCFTPGQVIFPDLTAGNNYDLDVAMPGYETKYIYSLNIFGNQSIIVELNR